MSRPTEMQPFSRDAVVDPQVVYALAREWYADRLTREWTPRSAAEAEAVFARHGLTGPFWRFD